jgi:hypothetical protein
MCLRRLSGFTVRHSLGLPLLAVVRVATHCTQAVVWKLFGRCPAMGWEPGGPYPGREGRVLLPCRFCPSRSPWLRAPHHGRWVKNFVRPRPQAPAWNRSLTRAPRTYRHRLPAWWRGEVTPAGHDQPGSDPGDQRVRGGRRRPDLGDEQAGDGGGQCVILLVLGLATGSAGYAVLSLALHALVAHH